MEHVEKNVQQNIEKQILLNERTNEKFSISVGKQYNPGHIGILHKTEYGITIQRGSETKMRNVKV